jgi:serine/threonine protein kinase
VLSEELPAQLAWFRQGSVVAGYRLEAQVGAGGMAVVFRARDERLGRPVALKILAPGLASDPAFRRRFIAESRAAAAVDDPHIIPIYEAGEAEGALFIAMRFVQGGDLRHVLAREGALPPGRAAEFLSPVASALDAAHGAGLVHRDVKPANILVDVRLGRPDHVYLSDFGVSKGAAASMSLTGTGQFLGTPDYSAPEQIQGRPVDGCADQYALACVTYQLLTGEAPFERDQGMAVLLAHLSEPPPSLVERRPDLPAAADEVLARALAKVPEKRFGSCADFADALRAALGLASYDPRGTAPVPAPDHPPTVIAAPQPESVGSEGSGKPVDPAEPAPGPAEPAPALADPAPGVSDDSAAPVPADLAAPATIDALPGRPLAAADAHTADQPLPSIPPADGEVRPTRRRHRIVAIVLVGAVLAVVCVVGVLANLQPGNITEKLTATLTDPGASGVASVAFSPNGATLAAGGGNGKIYLWNVATRKVTGNFH